MMKTLISGCAILLLGVNSPGLARQENPPERIVVPLSDPGRPATVKANLMNGGIRVVGHDSKELVVEAKIRTKTLAKKRDAEGMWVIPNPGLGLTLEEENNLVRVSGSVNETTDLTIYVPRKTFLELGCVNNGDIRVEKVEGEISVNNLNGAIRLGEVSGSVVANSTNGDIIVSLEKIDRDKPMSFVSFNGKVDVTFPGDLKADVRLKTDHGTIYSDFDIALDNSIRRTEEQSGDNGGAFRVKIESGVFGKIAGGGQEIRLSTYNGDIFLRAKK